MAAGSRTGRTRPPAVAVLGLALFVLGSGACRRSRPSLSAGDAAVVVVQAPLQPPPGVSLVLREADAPAGPGPMVLTLGVDRIMALEGALDASGGADHEDLYLIELVSREAAHAGTPAGSPSAPTHQLTVEITPAAGLATALVMSEGGAADKVLASSRAGAARRHALPNVAAVVGGNYLLAVRRGGGDGAGKGKAVSGQAPTTPSPYMLVLRAAPLGAADEREPNETPASATVTGPAHSEPQLAGYLGGPGDRDLFQVPVGQTAENSRFTVELALPAEGAAALTVSDASGRRVAQAKGRKGERVVIKDLTPAALQPVGQPAAAHFLVEVATEGPGEPFKRYVLGVRSDVAGGP